MVCRDNKMSVALIYFRQSGVSGLLSTVLSMSMTATVLCGWIGMLNLLNPPFRVRGRGYRAHVRLWICVKMDRVL